MTHSVTPFDFCGTIVSECDFDLMKYRRWDLNPHAHAELRAADEERL
jgi:hypothetical protein